MLSKVPAVTLGFWAIKILATTLGETGGDTVTMTWLGETTAESNGLGYLIGTGIFAVAAGRAGRAADQGAPVQRLALLGDHRGLDHGRHHDGRLLRSLARHRLRRRRSALLVLVLASLGLWRWMEGTVSVDTVNTPRVEIFYWITITFSQTLGTALGDWMADDAGVGFLGGVGIFGAALAVVAALYFWTRISRVVLFWVAFILTRPLGATLGDLLDKPHGTAAWR